MTFIRSGLVALSLVLGGGAQAQERVVNVYNWSDYIDPKNLDDFTKETGVKVIYDTYDSNETLETKLLAGQTGYDVVVPSATFLQRQIQAGVYQKLDKSKLPNMKGLWPAIVQRLAAYDPGNQYAVNYMWYSVGIAWNVDKVKQRLGDKPLDSWDYALKPDLIKKLADCGVYMIDSPEDLFAAALRFVGLPPDSKSPDAIHRAADALIRIKPYVKKFHSSEYINALANGDICMAVGWAGDAFQARNRAREAGNGVDVSFAIPREGALMSLDNFAIPKDAPHVDAAHLFIDYMMRPEVAARNTALTNFANGVIASKPFVPKEALDNPAIYPTDDVLARLYTVSANDQTTQRFITREWTRVKSGK